MESAEFELEKALKDAPHWWSTSRQTTAKSRTAHSAKSVGFFMVTLRKMFICPLGALTGLLR